MKYLGFSSLLILTALVSTFAGCAENESASSPEPSSPSSATSMEKHDHKAHKRDMASGQSDMDKMKAALAKMDPEDAADAEKQHFCPVSGKMLGVMGTPKKVSVNAHTVWICCSGCEDKLRSDPDTYLAKLNHGH